MRPLKKARGLSRVHPRIRGEDTPEALTPPPLTGSPPHPRGRCFVSLVHIFPSGFTPAYAGKMGCCTSFYTARGVHPRIRGEDLLDRDPYAYMPGSPPHTRGRYKFSSLGQMLGRFTPAYAGKIAGRHGDGGGVVVHPRIRGEDTAAPSGAPHTAGSPPHTRGR